MLGKNSILSTERCPLTTTSLSPPPSHPGQKDRDTDKILAAATRFSCVNQLWLWDYFLTHFLWFKNLFEAFGSWFRGLEKKIYFELGNIINHFLEKSFKIWLLSLTPRLLEAIFLIRFQIMHTEQETFSSSVDEVALWHAFQDLNIFINHDYATV